MCGTYRGVTMRAKLASVEQTVLAYPTPIRRFVYGDIEQFNSELATRILAMRDASPGLQRSNVGGWHSDAQLLHQLGQELGGRLAKMFVENVRAAMMAVAELDAPLPEQVAIEAWANVNT